MRVLAFFIGIVMTVAGSAGAYALHRAVGPGDLSGVFGFGEEATRPAGGGSTYDARNAQRIIDGLRGEVGPEARVGSFTLEPDGADATVVGRRGQRSVELDASGRVGPNASFSRSTGPRATIGIARLDAAGIERAVKSAREQSGNVAAVVTRLSLDVSSRSWRIDLDRGDATSFEANLDGRAVRLSGEPNPRGLGADPDSLLRPVNLKKLIADATEQNQGSSKATGFTVRPGQGNLQMVRGSRTLNLNYGFEAELTSRSLMPATTGSGTIDIKDVPSDITSRLLRVAKRAYPRKRLRDVDYFSAVSNPVLGTTTWALYFVADKSGETKYVVVSGDFKKLIYPT